MQKRKKKAIFGGQFGVVAQYLYSSSNPPYDNIYRHDENLRGAGICYKWKDRQCSNISCKYRHPKQEANPSEESNNASNKVKNKNNNNNNNNNSNNKNNNSNKPPSSKGTNTKTTINNLLEAFITILYNNLSLSSFLYLSGIIRFVGDKPKEPRNRVANNPTPSLVPATPLFPGGSDEKIIYVWDIENCAVPQNLTAFDVATKYVLIDGSIS